MWDSKIQIDGGAKDVVLTSMLEARNLVVLKVCLFESLIAKMFFPWYHKLSFLCSSDSMGQ